MHALQVGRVVLGEVLQSVCMCECVSVYALYTRARTCCSRRGPGSACMWDTRARARARTHTRTHTHLEVGYEGAVGVHELGRAHALVRPELLVRAPPVDVGGGARGVRLPEELLLRVAVVLFEVPCKSQKHESGECR